MNSSRAAKASKENAAEQGATQSTESTLKPAAGGIHDHLLRLQRNAGNRAVDQALKSDGSLPGSIQGRLIISQPGDKYEQEADRIADQVMQMPASEVGTTMPSITPIQTQSAQRDTSSRDVPTVTPSVQAKIEGLQRSGGEPLPKSIRDFMEPRLGQDLGAIRIHRNLTANDVAGELQARAFVVRNHIIFGREQFHFSNGVNDPLLTHELVHTLQQKSSSNHMAVQRFPIGGSEVLIPETTNSQAEQFLKSLLSLPTEEMVARISEISDTVLLHQIRNALSGYRATSTEARKKFQEIFNALTHRINTVVGEKVEVAKTRHKEEKQKRRREEVMRMRAEKKNRLTGESRPHSVQDVLAQLNVAMELNTADEPDFPKSERILVQVNDWFEKIVSSDNFDRHRSNLAGNLTEAEAFVYAAKTAVFSLLLKSRIYSMDSKPVPKPIWGKEISYVKVAKFYLEILSDKPSEEGIRFVSTIREANKVKGTVGLIAASAPFIAPSIGAGVMAVGAEVGALARLVPLFAQSPRIAVTLLGGQIALNPDFYYGAFVGLVGATMAVAEVGGPEKFVEKASTPEGRAELAGQILLALMSFGARGARAKGGAAGFKPGAPKAATKSESTSFTPSVPKEKGVATLGASSKTPGSSIKSADDSTKLQEKASQIAAEERGGQAQAESGMIKNRTVAVSEKKLGNGVKRRRIIATPKTPKIQLPRQPRTVTRRNIQAVHTRIQAMKAKGIKSDSFNRLNNTQLASHSEIQQIVADPSVKSIGVSTPMCGNCIEYFRAEARFQARRLEVADPFTRREFNHDGSYTEFWGDGTIVHVEGFGNMKSLSIEPGRR